MAFRLLEDARDPAEVLQREVEQRQVHGFATDLVVLDEQVLGDRPEVINAGDFPVELVLIFGVAEVAKQQLPEVALVDGLFVFLLEPIKNPKKVKDIFG